MRKGKGTSEGRRKLEKDETIKRLRTRKTKKL
jgi:hypothetical protein